MQFRRPVLTSHAPSVPSVDRHRRVVAQPRECRRELELGLRRVGRALPQPLDRQRRVRVSSMRHRGVLTTTRPPAAGGYALSSTRHRGVLPTARPTAAGYARRTRKAAGRSRKDWSRQQRIRRTSTTRDRPRRVRARAVAPRALGPRRRPVDRRETVLPPLWSSFTAAAQWTGVKLFYRRDGPVLPPPPSGPAWRTIRKLDRRYNGGVRHGETGCMRRHEWGVPAWRAILRKLDHR